LYPTRQEAMTDVREYVSVYYNSQRLHSTSGSMFVVGVQTT
jgi:hypothetical protein